MQEPSGDVPNANVSGQGIQVGSGNTQNNTWLKNQLDPTYLRALNPHSAAERIRQLSHDDAVDLLTKASPRDVTDVLEALLSVDENKAVAVLADLSRDKVAHLIQPFAEQAPWLKSLTEAAVATAKYAAKLGWGRQGKIGLLKRVKWSKKDGYMRSCASGRVYWSVAYGTQAVTGAINEYHIARGLDYFGLPVSPQRAADKSPYGTMGIFQEFEHATVYSSDKGIYDVYVEHAMKAYAHEGGSGGRLGFPCSEYFELDDYYFQLFEGGAISESWFDRDDANAVFAEVKDYLEGIGGLVRWFPLSPESIGKASPSRSAYRMQHFKDGKGNRLTVYVSEERGIHGVRGGIKAYCDGNKAAASRLGLPIDEALEVPRGWVQRFEFGTIFDRTGREAFAVPIAIINQYGEDGNISTQLRWPTSDEETFGENNDRRIQFFERGVITVRDGKREIWLRPPPETEPLAEP